MGIEEIESDFRVRATTGIGLAALTLLLPFVIVNLASGSYFLAAGAVGITAMLLIGVRQARRGRDHQKLLLYVFVPAGTLFVLRVFTIDPIVASVWCYPTIVAFYCTLNRRRAIIANAVLLVGVLPMMVATMTPMVAGRFAATLVGVSLFAQILVREIDAMRRRLRFQIEHDPLTGLLNRSSLGKRLDAVLEARAAHGTPAALLSLDLDHFKVINDRFGHEAGDLVLREVSRLLRASVPDGSRVFRMGGEEFLILLEESAEEEAIETGEALRSAVASATILQHHRVTVSVGVASLHDTDERASWMRRADERLYAAKSAGRDRVVAVDPPFRDIGLVRPFLARAVGE